MSRKYSVLNEWERLFFYLEIKEEFEEMIKSLESKKDISPEEDSDHLTIGENTQGKTMDDEKILVPIGSRK